MYWMLLMSNYEFVRSFVPLFSRTFQQITIIKYNMNWFVLNKLKWANCDDFLMTCNNSIGNWAFWNGLNGVQGVKFMTNQWKIDQIYYYDTDASISIGLLRISLLLFGSLFFLLVLFGIFIVVGRWMFRGWKHFNPPMNRSRLSFGWWWK